MIKSITNFINGDVFIKSETNASVYLSDGTHWNKKNFHQTRSLVSAFIRREIDLDPAMQELKRTITENHKESERVLQEVKDKLERIAPSKELFYLSNILMPFGKYKGKKLSYVATNDISYYNWLFDSTLFEPFGLKNLSRTHSLVTKLDTSLDTTSSKKDDELPF